MDELGLVGAVPASVLRPTDPKARLVGRALTVKNVASRQSVPENVAGGVSGMAEIEAHNLAQPGDVLVLQGLDQVSNMGGMSASIGRRQGQLGAIVDGAVRDVEHGRAIGYAIWSRSVSPITGKWRVKTVAVNKPVDDLRCRGQSRRSGAGGRDRRLHYPAPARRPRFWRARRRSPPTK